MNNLAQVAGIGHNRPPANTPEDLQAELTLENRELLDRADALIDVSTSVPEVLADDEQSSKVTDLVAMIAACQKSLEKKREAAKEPYLTFGRLVDGFFNGKKQRLDTAKTTANKAQTAYLMRKAAEEKRLREEAARLAREDADRKLEEARQAEAAKMTTLADQRVTEAVVLNQEAAVAERKAEQKSAQMAKSVGTYGKSQTLTTVWVGKVDDRNAIDWNILAPYLAADAIDKALNAAIRAGVRAVAGCSISEEQRAVLR